VFGVLAAVAGSSCRTSPQDKEAKYLKRGDALVAKKEFARAVLEFRNAAQAVPKDAEPYYRMGLAYLASGNLTGGVRSLQKATLLNPKHAGAQLKLAELMTGTREPEYIEQAVARLQVAFGDSPENPEAIDTLAIAEWKLGKPEDATRRLEEALTKFPTHLRTSVALARMRLDRSDWAGAEEVLKKAVADAPKSAPAELALGNLYFFLKQPDKAEAEFKKALQLDSQSADALIGVGAIQIAGKRMDEADQTYKRLAALPDKTYKSAHAMFVYQFGKRETAIAEFEAMAKADPSDRNARTRLVSMYYAMNRIPDAENLLTAALKQNPTDTDALLQRADLCLRFGKVEDAEKDVNTVLHFNPESAAAHFLLARVYWAKHLAKNQQQELEQTLRLNPGMLPARLTLEVALLSAHQAKAALAVADAAPEGQKIQTQWILGRNWALLSLGNWKDAKAGIDSATQRGVPEAVFQNAILRFLEKDYVGARADIEELVKRGVTDPKVVDLLVQTYVAQQNSSKGLERLKEIASAQPKSAGLQQLLGQWYTRTGNPLNARQAFESAKAANPHFTPADLSLVELDLDEGRRESARQRLNAVLGADPKNVPALLLLARTNRESGDRASEIEAYRAALSVDSTNLIALNNLAYELAGSSPEEALKFAQQALEEAPTESSIQDTLGWIYYRRGLYSIAVPYLKNAVEKDPNPRRQFHLGMTYLKTGDQVAGQRLVREALQKDPNLAKTEQGW
jgi:tetratricopeptide (TPR) repeat protein